MTRNIEPLRMPWPRAIPDDYTTYMNLEPDLSLTDYDDVYGYALTIDGYKYALEKWGVDDSSNDGWKKIQSFKQNGKWLGSFEDLRCCLFFYQRNIRGIESGAFAGEERKEFMEIYVALCDLWQSEQR